MRPDQLDPIPTAEEIHEILWDLCTRYDKGDRDAVRRYTNQLADEFARVANTNLDRDAVDDSRAVALYGLALVLVLLAAFLAVGVGVLDLGVVAMGGALVVAACALVVASIGDRIARLDRRADQ